MTTTMTLQLGDANITITHDDKVVAAPKAPKAEVPATKRTTKPKASEPKAASRSAKLSGKEKLAKVRGLVSAGKFSEAQEACAEYGWDPVRTDKRLAPKPKASEPKASKPKAKAPSKKVAKSTKSKVSEAVKQIEAVGEATAAKLSTKQRKAVAEAAELQDHLKDTYGISDSTAKLFLGSKSVAKRSLGRMDEAELLITWMELTTMDESPLMGGEADTVAKAVAEMVELADAMSAIEDPASV